MPAPRIVPTSTSPYATPPTVALVDQGTTTPLAVIVDVHLMASLPDRPRHDTNVLGVIEDDVMFGNLCDEDSVRLCLILALCWDIKTSLMLLKT
ncbi:hypothetical protein Tco_0712111 [Tanacetum coccineum]